MAEQESQIRSERMCDPTAKGAPGAGAPKERQREHVPSGLREGGRWMGGDAREAEEMDVGTAGGGEEIDGGTEGEGGEGKGGTTGGEAGATTGRAGGERGEVDCGW